MLLLKPLQPLTLLLLKFQPHSNLLGYDWGAEKPLSFLHV
jgi:hypothetical protein